MDDIIKFEKFLKDNNQKEFDTPTALTGLGGKHYFFKYINNPNVKNTSNSFGPNSKIDIKNDGGC